MGWRRSEIEVYHCIDLSDYDDEIMEYMEPDNIIDALELMDRWGYSDGDILDHMLEDMDNELFLGKVADILTVESALSLVKSVYEYGHSIQVRNLEAKSNQINELKQRVDARDNEVTELTLKIDELLAMNHTIIKDQEQEKKEDMGYES